MFLCSFRILIAVKFFLRVFDLLITNKPAKIHIELLEILFFKTLILTGHRHSKDE